METTTPKFGGLRPLPIDANLKKDFSLGGVFGVPNPSDLPTTDFYASTPLEYKDQKTLDDCTGNDVAAVREDEVGVPLSAEFNFYITKVLIEKMPSAFGANLRDACLAPVKYGSITEILAYQYLKDKYSRDEMLNPATWPQTVLDQAAQYLAGAMFTVDYHLKDPTIDLFTSLRMALWNHRQAASGTKMSVAVGSTWYQEWTYAPGGIIPKTYSTPIAGHAFKIYGQKVINGELYIVAQLSNGINIGDGGKFYFPASVVNKEFGPYGQYMFLPMDPKEAAWYHNNKISVNDNWITVWIKTLLLFINPHY